MNVFRVLVGNRREFCMGLIGLAGLATGCGEGNMGGGGGGTPTSPPLIGGMKPGEAEGKARMKGLGTAGMPTTKKGAPSTPKTP
jgi:hypothetical protein